MSHVLLVLDLGFLVTGMWQVAGPRHGPRCLQDPPPLGSFLEWHFVGVDLHWLPVAMRLLLYPPGGVYRGPWNLRTYESTTYGIGHDIHNRDES